MTTRLLLLFTLLPLVLCCSNPDKEATAKIAEPHRTPVFATKARRFRAEYVQNYGNSFVFDSVYTSSDGQTIQLHMKHYCLFDSTLAIPGRYLWEDSTATFITHNYASDIVIQLGRDTVFTRRIRKEDFQEELSPELKHYGILTDPLNPEFHKESNRLRFGYSIGIPITDVGIGVGFSIGTDGRLVVEKE